MSLSILLSAALSAHSVVSVEQSDQGAGLSRTAYEVEVGDSPLNHYSVVHVERQRCRRSRGAVMLLAPFTLPAEFYEISERGRYSRSLAGRLAREGYDIWLVGQRQTGLQPGSCESGAADCSVLGEWGAQAYVDDALFALSLLREESPDSRPVIGGFSAGSNMALATVNQAPDEFSGLMLYEGTFFAEDATITAHNAPICAATTAMVEQGQVFDPSAAVLGTVLQLAQADPDGLFPLPIFPEGTTNWQAMLYVYSAPPPPGAFAPTPWFVRNLADFQTQTFLHTDPQRLFQVGPLFDNYGSVAALRDLACGLAGVDDTHVDRLGEFEGEVLVFVAGTGFGPAMVETAGLFENAASVRIESNSELGEADFYFHDRWERVFLKPLRRWLR